jgi:hypothetical protein
MVAAGTYMTYQSVSSQPPSETNVKVAASQKSVEFEIKTAIPGIILIVIGGVGLILMVMKVPAKEIVGYQQPPRSRGPSDMVMYTLSTSPKPIYSTTTTNVPLLVWWLIKSKGVFVSERENA